MLAVWIYLTSTGLSPLTRYKPRNRARPAYLELPVKSEAVAALRGIGDAVAVAGRGADWLHGSRELRTVGTDAGAASDKRQHDQRQQSRHDLLPLPPVPARQRRVRRGRHHDGCISPNFRSNLKLRFNSSLTRLILIDSLLFLRFLVAMNSVFQSVFNLPRVASLRW